MKSFMEIQRAHDILAAVVLGELPVVRVPDPEAQKRLTSALDALCWVLGDACESQFAGNLKEIEAAAQRGGFVLGRKSNR